MEPGIIIQHIIDELERAEKMFPEWPDDLIHRAAIVAEEAGELVRACLQEKYEPYKKPEAAVEAVQTAAMAIRFLKNYGVRFAVRGGASEGLKISKKIERELGGGGIDGSQGIPHGGGGGCGRYEIQMPKIFYRFRENLEWFKGILLANDGEMVCIGETMDSAQGKWYLRSDVETKVRT